MTVPNAERAIIAAGEAHRVPAEHVAQARRREGEALLGVGYRSDDPQPLESDLRDAAPVTRRDTDVENAYGVVYEIEGPIRTPSGRTVRFCSIWQIDTGTEVPRFITMYPR